MGGARCAGVPHSALYYKSLDEAMECGAVIPARLRQHQEVADMVGGPVRFHLDFEGAQRGLDGHGAPEFIERGVHEWLRLLFLDSHALNADRGVGKAVITRGNTRYLL